MCIAFGFWDTLGLFLAILVPAAALLLLRDAARSRLRRRKHLKTHENLSDRANGLSVAGSRLTLRAKQMSDGFLTSPMRLTNAADLHLVNELLHDEVFELDTIKFCQATHTVTVPVRRRFHSGPERLIVVGHFSKTYEKDWMHSVVTIRRVRAWKTVRDQGINSYMFESLRYEKDIIEIKSCEVMVLKLAVDDLDVTVADIGLKGKAQIKRGPLGIERFSGRVYE